MLDKSRDEMYAYQNRHGLQGTLDHPYSFLVKDSHLQNLTAHERSTEWNSASQWYGGRVMKAKPKQTTPSTEERAKITTMAAAGLSQNRIAKTIGRTRHMVQNSLAEPEMKLSVQDEKAELSALYKDKAREVLLSIDAETIAKGNLLQKATSAAFF